MRDQQAVTDKGLIISKMSKPQRQRETLLTKFFWEILKKPIIHEIQSPGTFEGGDFMPMGEFALIGMGDRTNRKGVEQMLEYGVGYDEIGVVHQPNHPLIPGDNRDPMVNMHLDTYFNIVSKEVAVGCELLLKNAMVEIYHKSDDGYIKTPEEVNLHDYMLSKDFDIINITTLEQMAYASNFLCIRDGTILAVEVDRVIKNVLEKLRAKAIAEPHRYKKLFNQAKKDYRELRLHGQFFPHKKEIYQHDVDAYPLNLVNLTGGYGGAHCMSCALKRS
jgi:arginine deiminase